MEPREDVSTYGARWLDFLSETDKFRRMGGFELAEKQYIEMVAMLRKAEGPSTSDLALMLDHLAEFYLEERNFDLAYQTFSEARVNGVPVLHSEEIRKASLDEWSVSLTVEKKTSYSAFYVKYGPAEAPQLHFPSLHIPEVLPPVSAYTESGPGTIDKVGYCGTEP